MTVIHEARINLTLIITHFYVWSHSIVKANCIEFFFKKSIVNLGWAVLSTMRAAGFSEDWILLYIYISITKNFDQLEESVFNYSATRIEDLLRNGKSMLQCFIQKKIIGWYLEFFYGLM